MVTENTNTVYNCATCEEPKALSPRYREWVHVRADSLCEDDREPVSVRLTVPARTGLVRA